MLWPGRDLALVLILVPVVACLGGAGCGGGETSSDKVDGHDDGAVGDDDDDASEPTGDTGTEGVPTGPTGPTGSTGDTGSTTYPYGHNDLVILIIGGATVDLVGGTYAGSQTERYYLRSTDTFCNITFQAQDLPSSPLADTTPRSDPSTCAYGSEPCAFSFDLGIHSPTLSSASDCKAFGITEASLAGSEFVTSYGVVDEYSVAYKTSGGSTFQRANDLLVYWVDYRTYVGWYLAFDSLYGAAYTPYGALDTLYDDATGAFQYTRLLYQ